MKYTIEATETGYQMEVRSHPNVLHNVFNEMGGHGPLGQAYAELDKLSHRVLVQHRQEVASAAAVYRGYGGFLSEKVTVDRGRVEQPLHHIVVHSPSGFSWGYTGSGPTDLAFSILMDHFINERPCDLVGGEELPVDHNQFKIQVVNQWPWDKKGRASHGRPAWELTSTDIERWLVMFARAAA